MDAVSVLLEISVFVIGLSIGSFLNVVIIRSREGETIRGRSHCRACKKTLSARELIPIASFLLQKGRCRGCGTAFSLQYPLVELGTGLAFTAAAFLFPQDFLFDVRALTGFILVCIGIAAGIVILVSDLRFQIIPNGAVFVLLILGIIRLFVVAKPPYGGLASVTLVNHASAYDIGFSIIFALFFAGLWFFSQGKWMGFGDVKLIGATSLIVGFPVSIIAFLFSFWLGGIVGTILLLSSRKNWGRRIPFGPFILAGTALAFFISRIYPPFLFFFRFF